MCMMADNAPDRLEKDSEVSPGTMTPRPQPANARANIAPWDDGPSPMQQPRGNGNEFPMHQGTGNMPSINRQPPSASPWTNPSSNNDLRQMPTSVFGSFYNDSSENLSQISPGFAPPGGMGFPGEIDDRRPSVASATTVSSVGSKGSIGGRFHKKLQGFFGDEFTTVPDGSRQNSETSSIKGTLPAFAPGGSRNRNNSMNDPTLPSSPPSPTGSRPRTPAHGPSSEVTPWVFQDPQVSCEHVRCSIND
jgi:adenylate cyclase